MLERYRYLLILWDGGANGGLAFIIFPIAFDFWLWRLHMIPHLCFGYAVIRGFSIKDSPATVLLRHRLGRRVAAETGPATMFCAIVWELVSWALLTHVSSSFFLESFV